jgi:hypothetical protein
VLNADKDTLVALEDVGSKGKETTYFGPATKAAVIKFQQKYKDIVLTLNSITTADGKVNRATRTRLNLLVGVINTYDSVGIPQKIANTEVVIIPAPIIITTPATSTVVISQPGISICSFINFLSNLGIVSSSRANQAKLTFKCTSTVIVDNGEANNSTNNNTNSNTSDNATSTEDDNNLVTQKVLSTKGASSDIVLINSSDSLRTDSKLTIEAWVNPSNWLVTDGMNNTKDQVIISKGLLGDNIDYSLSLDNGKLVYSNNDASVWTCSPVVSLNKWTHVAVSVDEAAQNISLFINGVKATSTCEGPRGLFNKSSINKQYAISNSNTASSLYIGNYYPKYCYMQSKTNGFIGKLDDIKVWNISRIEAQIKDDMATTVKNTTGLVSYWSFDSGVFSDNTNNSNDGLSMGNVEIVEDNTSPSIIEPGDYSYEFNSDLTNVFPVCDSGLGENGGENAEEETSIELSFAGLVTYVGYCGGSDGNPNRYSLVVVKTPDGTTPVVGEISGPDNAWQRDFGGDFGSSNPKIQLVLRHAPVTGAPLPKVGDCVIGSSTGEPDTCSTTTVSQANIIGLAKGSSLSQACSSGKGSGFVAGGIIKKLGIGNTSNCKGVSSGGGGSSENWFQRTFNW